MTAAGRLLRARTRADLPARIARSAAVRDAGVHLRTDEFDAWLAARGRAHRFAVERVPFSALDGWRFDETTGDLGHSSGRFFTVRGLGVRHGEGPVGQWEQPVIEQPEVGVLGILVKEFDGVLHCLMQAKMEPGNPNLLQLSPTVQATRSNYTRVHRGSGVRHIERFVRPEPGRVLADVLQSEQGSWFYRKSNRNMIVEAEDEVPLHEDFCWLTLGQLGELLRRDNVVNMDARTVLACAPVDPHEAMALHPDIEVLSWISGERSRHQVRTELVPLSGLRGWTRDDHTVRHVDDRYFRVVAVSVEAGNREVSNWSQPLLEPCGLGLNAFLTRRFDGVPHLLAHAKVEAGFLDTIELGPTVQYTPENYAHLGPRERPAFLDLVLGADPSRLRYAAVHSEEGGRFLNAESRYLFMECGEAEAPRRPPPGYCWITPGQLCSLVRHGHYVDVEARTLLSLLNTGAVAL
ncbi:NDP-hexose 2,3-dehydratase family protein [Streptomyces sp. NPDC060006]|uniref:NDP-hexose 2,3-dehydratase family protein n=1 Tax=unclassified Streptomyces TaxID=2593676 RepID=UPI0036788FFA